MSTCLNHPEVPTDRRCELCGQAFCDACLEVFDGLGPMCAECEAVLEKEAPAGLQERLPQLREEVRRQIPPDRKWWGWELMFWSVVALPTLLALLYLSQLFQYQRAMAIISREPLLPGQTVLRLTDVGAGLERYHAAHQAYPATLTDLKAPDLPDPALTHDLYDPQEAPLLYTQKDGRYLLCSRGPDRHDDKGQPLDRFSGTGDLCIGKID